MQTEEDSVLKLNQRGLPGRGVGQRTPTPTPARGPHVWLDLPDPSLAWGKGCRRDGDHSLHLVKGREGVLKKERNLPVAHSKPGVLTRESAGPNPWAPVPPTQSHSPRHSLEALGRVRVVQGSHRNAQQAWHSENLADSYLAHSRISKTVLRMNGSISRSK